MDTFQYSTLFALCGLLFTSHVYGSPPQASADGICYVYTVQAGDICASLASTYGITVDEIEKYNKNTWEYDWTGCSKLVRGAFICLSSGSPPMPAALPNAICGPQVPGTSRPDDMSDLASLNPCLASNCQCVLSNGLCSNTKDMNAGCPTGSASTSPASATKSTSISTTKTTSIFASETSVDVIPITTTDWTSTTQSASTSSSTTQTSVKRHSDLDFPPWEIAMYSEKDCSGDYYVVSGSNQDPGECLNLHDNSISSRPSTSGTWCRWFTDGGLKSNDCDAGTITTPASWYLSGICQIFPATDCTDLDGTSAAYSSAGGGARCKNYSDGDFQVSAWGSMRCGGTYGY